MPLPTDLSVVTATYNERENILLLIEELNSIFHRCGIHGEVVVVDDSSPDGTADAALEIKKKYPNTVLVKRPGKMGIGSAYRDGINASSGKVITLMDADFSQPPAILPQLYQAARQGRIGWGSRYMEKVKFESDIPHLIGTSILNRWISLWLKTNVKDHTLGYFAIRREHLHQILDYAAEKDIHPFDSVLYGLPIAALALKLGIVPLEIKSPYERRKFGISKINSWDGLKVVLSDMIYTISLRRKLRS